MGQGRATARAAGSRWSAGPGPNGANAGPVAEPRAGRLRAVRCSQPARTSGPTRAKAAGGRGSFGLVGPWAGQQRLSPPICGGRWHKPSISPRPTAGKRGLLSRFKGARMGVCPNRPGSQQEPQPCPRTKPILVANSSCRSFTWQAGPTTRSASSTRSRTVESSPTHGGFGVGSGSVRTTGCATPA